MSTLPLHCLLSDDVADKPDDRIFIVRVLDTDEVIILKDEIKEKAGLSSPAKDLDLLKVNLPLTDIKSHLGRLDHGACQRLSPAPAQLSTFFHNPGRNLLHILVTQRPAANFPGLNSGSALMTSESFQLNRSQSNPPDEIDKAIKDFLSECRPRMQKLLLNAKDVSAFLPSWEPDSSADKGFKDHMSTLSIPAVQEKPSLLLHNLGEETTKLDRMRFSQIRDVFRGEEHTVLLNTSGSGKTRLLLDGLCRYWGFYFVADDKDVGSKDFATVIGDLNQYQDYKRAMEMNKGSLKSPESMRYVQETASRGLSQLLLSRFLLLGLLIEELEKAGPKVSTSECRRLWVLLQVQPTKIFGGPDPFLSLAQLLRPARQFDLDYRIRDLCGQLFGKLSLSARQHFWCILDEAQKTAYYKDSFSADGLSGRSLLNEVWRSWTRVISPPQMCFILSGTGLKYQEVTNTSSGASSVLKQEDYRVVRDIGAFDNPADQAEYIRRYIPADWNDAKWQEFIKRSWAWFRGRYRSTATLVSLILQVGCQSPHKVINSYVEKFTGFQPTDANDWVQHEPDLLSLPDFPTLDFNRMSHTQMKTLAGVLFDQTLYGTYSLSSISEENRRIFIEYGFARTRKSELIPRTMLDEPTMILAALNWVNQDALLSHHECLRHESNSDGFKNYFAFYVRKYFETPKSLDQLFEFRSDFDKIVDWKSEEFELVTVSRESGSNQPCISVVTSDGGPSSNIGFKGEKGEDVISWISTNAGQFAFCFPHKYFGADVMFFIRSMISRRLLLVMAQCKNHRKVELETLIVGIRSVTPDWVWKIKHLRYETAAESVFPLGPPGPTPAELALQTIDALQNIPQGLTLATAQFPILRVFASWDGEAHLDRSMPQTTATTGKKRKKQKRTTKNRNAQISRKLPRDVDLHPLATLHLENFNRFSREMDINWFRGDVEQKEVIYLKRSSSSVSLDNTAERVKRTRRETGDGMDCQ